MNATRKSLGLAGILASLISLIFACTLLMSSVCAQPAFAGTTDETLLGTMAIQLDTSEPDNPNPDPDNPNPNPNPDDNGNGDNGDGSGSNANKGDDNNGNLGDGALKASAYNGKNGKGSLSNTGDVVSTVLIALFALSAVFLGCVYLSRRRAVSASGVDNKFKTTNISKLRTAFVAMLAVALIAGGVMSALKAFADGDVTDSGSSNTVDATSTVIVDKDGNVKSTSITLQNKLKTPVTVKSISAPTELSSWTSTIDANTEIAAEGETSGTWNTGDGKIPVSILKQLSEGNPSIELSFESQVSYTSYDVSWSANGGNGVFDTTPVPANGNVVLPANEPTREHYTFAGWNKDADGNGEEVTDNTIVTGDVTFYAKWTPETYKISYEFPDGGEFAGGVTPESSYTYGVGVDSFEEPYKQGYDFDGWYDAETDGNKVTSISTNDFGDKTLYARWTPGTNTKYVVKHYLQNIEDDEYSYNIGGDVELEGTTGEKTSATAKTITGYEPVLPISQQTIAADGSTVVRINYNRKKCTVTFDNNGRGGNSPSPVTVKYQQKATRPTNPTATGYTFVDWYTTPECTGISFDFENTQITKDMTLYAKWIAKTYTVKFDKNDASATGTMQDQTFTFDVAQKLTACTFTKADATFLGWAETADGEVKYTDAKEVKNLSSTGGETITLYAKWQDGYTVTFDASGGEGSSASGYLARWGVGANINNVESDEVLLRKNDTLSDTNLVDSACKPTLITPSGYVFAGWFTEPNGGGEEGIIGTTKVTKDITYYASYVNTTFMTKSTSTTTANPRGIAGTKFSMKYLQQAAIGIKNNKSNSKYYTQFNDWMTNDSFHLYTLLKGTDGNYLDPDSTDSWVEFRIVHVGEKDTGDGTGLTFQAVHMLPKAYQTNSTNTNTGGWDNSELKTKMNSGEIFNMFDTQLTTAVKPLTKGKLWLASFSELTGTSHSYFAEDGKQFAYWNGKVTNPIDSNSCLVIAGTRSGGSVASINDIGHWWGRSPNINSNKVAFMVVGSNGRPNYFDSANISKGVVPCFSL